MAKEQHVHDCTNPTMTCACGWQFVVSRFMFSVDIFDNRTKQDAVNVSFGTESPEVCAQALERAAAKIRRLR